MRPTNYSAKGLSILYSQIVTNPVARLSLVWWPDYHQSGGQVIPSTLLAMHGQSLNLAKSFAAVHAPKLSHFVVEM